MRKRRNRTHHVLLISNRALDLGEELGLLADGEGLSGEESLVGLESRDVARKNSSVCWDDVSVGEEDDVSAVK